MMERIYFLIAHVKVRQAEMLQAAEKDRQVKKLKKGERGPRVKILPGLGAVLFAWVGRSRSKRECRCRSGKKQALDRM
jgi:hypothetical protein